MAKTFGNKVGTPRGYVDKEARDKVDEAMQPVAEVGKQVLWLTPMGRAVRGGKGIYEGGKALFRRATSGAAKEVAKDTGKVAQKAVTKGGTSRPARGVKPGSMRQQSLDELKQGPKMPSQARDVKPGSARQKTLDSLKQGPKQPEKAADMVSGGARANALKEARAANRAANRKPRPGEKKFIGPTNKPQPGDRKFIGPSNKPQPGDKRFIGPSNKPQPGDKNFIGPQRRAPQAGEKDFIGPTRGAATSTRNFGSMSRGQKIAAGAGAAATAAVLYKGADRPKASNQTPPAVQPSGPRDDRAGTSPSNRAAEFKKKRQGMNVPGSPTNPNKAGPKKAGEKPRAAAKPEKKMSNFERMKQRQYEKEGYGGRSVTSRGAESRVKKERSYKFKDLFRKK